MSRGRRDVDLEDTRVRRDGEAADGRRWRRRVALQDHVEGEVAADGIDRADEVEEVLGGGERGEEDEDGAFAGLDADGGADRAGAWSRGRGRDGDRALRRGLLGAARVGDLEGLLDDAEGLAGAERAEREAEADGAVPGEEEEVAPAEGPALAGPAAAGARDGEHEADLATEALAEDAREAAAILRVVEVGVERVDADGEVLLVLEEAPRVLVRFA